MKEKMKWLLFSVLASTFLLSCGKDDVQNLGGESKQVQLELSAVYNPEAAQDQQALAMDFKEDAAGKVKASLDGKSTIPVYTYIYKGSSPTRIFGELLNWTVQADKKTLKYDGSITLSAATVASASDLRVVAVIADGNDQAALGKFDVTSSYLNNGTLQVFSATTPTTINVPYVLEANLTKGGNGELKTNEADEKIFKPYGHILRVKIKNKTGKKIAVKGLSSNKLLAKSATLAVLPGAEKTLTREEEQDRIDLNFSEKIEVENNQTANKYVLLWVPKMNDAGTYRLDLMVEGVDPTRLYTISQATKTPSQLKNGKIYNLNVEVYKTIINPLSLLSDDVINVEGTDFVNLRNTFQIDNLDTYNGPGKVGYFCTKDAINKFCDERTFPSTGNTKWHLPDFFEWYSIFYSPEKTPKGGYVDVYDGAERVKVGVGTKSSDGNPNDYYWRMVGYQVYVPAAARSTYVDQTGQTIPTIKTDHSYYILSFAKTTKQSGDPRFPSETTDYNRFAFRYTLKENRIEITCAPVGIQNIGVRDLPDHLVFSGISAVHRTIPFYGISNQAPFTRKDNLYGNRRIIDYPTNTTTLNWHPHPNGTGIVAAFSAPRNLIVAYPLDHRFPVALFKKAIED